MPRGYHPPLLNFICIEHFTSCQVLALMAHPPLLETDGIFPEDAKVRQILFHSKRRGRGVGGLFPVPKNTYIQSPISSDYQERARTILAGCRGGSVGSYTDSPGDETLGMDVLVDQNTGA